MQSWRQAFKEYHQQMKPIMLFLLRSLRGFCTALGMTFLILFFVSQDVKTGEWYISARMNALVTNLGGGLIGELGAIATFIFVIGLGTIADKAFNNK